MMFQSYALFPHLSVWENIAFGLRREGTRDKHLLVAPRCEEMLRLTRLAKFARSQTPSNFGGPAPEGGLGTRSLAKAPKLLAARRTARRTG